jgi:hypothetical protein
MGGLWPGWSRGQTQPTDSHLLLGLGNRGGRSSGRGNHCRGRRLGLCGGLRVLGCLGGTALLHHLGLAGAQEGCRARGEGGGAWATVHKEGAAGECKGSQCKPPSKKKSGNPDKPRAAYTPLTDCRRREHRLHWESSASNRAPGPRGLGAGRGGGSGRMTWACQAMQGGGEGTVCVRRHCDPRHTRTPPTLHSPPNGGPRCAH